MAERRMFAKTIVDSDAFLDMPLSAQALYFHLNMRADDDGFINNPRKIRRMIGASEDDLKLLIAKRFILAFETGVVVIKHWRMHNLLRKDRYTPTQYEEEKGRLSVKKNGSYTEKVLEIPDDNQTATTRQPDDNQTATTRQPDDNQTATQVRLGKDRLGKDRLAGSGEPEALPTSSKTNYQLIYQLIVDMFNETCISFPKVKSLSDSRKKAIKARLNTYSADEFKTCFEKAEASDFLKGRNSKNWSATFDWLIKDTNMAKVIDGNYDNKGHPVKGYGEAAQDQINRNRFNNFDQRSYDFAELEKNLIHGG